MFSVAAGSAPRSELVAREDEHAIRPSAHEILRDVGLGANHLGRPWFRLPDHAGGIVALNDGDTIVRLAILAVQVASGK